MDLAALASEIIDARCNRRFLEQPSRRFPSFTIGAGYAVSAAVAHRWCHQGHVRCGIKLGMTYRGAWSSLGTSAPVWAPIYADTVWETGSVRTGHLRAPRVEAEVILRIGSDLAPGASVEDIERGVTWAALGFELVDCHYPGWRLTPADLLADFGCHAGLAVSAQRLAVRPSALRELRIELHRDGEPVARGHGADVAGGPIEAIHAILASAHAPPIKDGDVVTTGALTRGSHPVADGQLWALVPNAVSNFEPITVRIET
jgi:2-keto-4-pentenoate hydratase